MKTFPVSVEWGGVWVNTVGRPGRMGKHIAAQVYDPHGREMVWAEFLKIDVRRGHSSDAWELTPERDYRRPGWRMVRQASSALTYALFRTDERGDIVGESLGVGMWDELERLTKG